MNKSTLIMVVAFLAIAFFVALQSYGLYQVYKCLAEQGIWNFDTDRCDAANSGSEASES